MIMQGALLMFPEAGCRVDKEDHRYSRKKRGQSISTILQGHFDLQLIPLLTKAQSQSSRSL